MSEQDLTPEQLEQLREQIASVPADAIVTDTAMQLIQMTWMRLGLPPEQFARFRDLDAARLLIDAFGGLLAATEGRLGPPSPASARPWPTCAWPSPRSPPTPRSTRPARPRPRSRRTRASCGRPAACGCRARTEEGTSTAPVNTEGPARTAGPCEPCVMPDVNEPKARPAPARYASGRTFEACGPLGPSVISNSTAWPSLRVL